MRLPTPLLRKNPDAYKNQLGHVLVLAGSGRMLGASALCGLSAMRSGAGLVTLGVPKSLNTVLHKKTSPILMTWPLPETTQQTFSAAAWRVLKPELKKFNIIAIGPGLSQNPATQKFIRTVIKHSPVPLVIDADALNALAGYTDLLTATTTPKILTPHPGEFKRLTESRVPSPESRKILTPHTTLKKSAIIFANKFKCILVLKGHRTVVASPDGKTYTNRTGNAGMATAGSGDVLTGMIAAFLAQGLTPFEAAKWAVKLHGTAGDLAAKRVGKTSLIATDIINAIPQALMKDKG